MENLVKALAAFAPLEDIITVIPIFIIVVLVDACMPVSPEALQVSKIAMQIIYERSHQ